MSLRSGTIGRMTLLAGLTCLAVYAILRGISHDVTGYAIVFYVVNYGDGLIRRGLSGEILSWFVDQRDLASVRAAVDATYLALQVGFLAALLVWVALVEWRRRDFVLLALFAVFLTSQFVPTMAADVGYLDLYDYLVLLIAVLGLARRWYAVVALAGLVGPFVHEAFIFCWLMLAVVALWERVSPGRLALLCLPLVSSAIIYLAASPDAIAAQMMRSVLPDGEKAFALRWHFGQSAMAVHDAMLMKLRHYPLNVAIASGFYVLPAMILVAVYGIARNSWRDTAALAAATLLPLSVLLFAWDLSRFLVGANCFALLAILYMETVRPAPRIAWPAPAACGVAALMLVQVPFTYVYFETGGIADRGPIDMRGWPIGRLTGAGVEFFKRTVGPRFVAEHGEELPPGDAWYVEENGWRGIWLRRPGTNVFDAVMVMGSDMVPYTATVERSGNTIIVRRGWGSDPGARQDYRGTLEGDTIRGTSPGGLWIAVVRSW